MGNNSNRSEKIAKNMFWATVGHMAYAVAGFVSRSVFVSQLGDAITGVATLFSSILVLLSMAELGFGSAAAIHLYKPVAEQDEKRICALINLYRRAYLGIGMSVLGIGLALMPFLHNFIKTDYTIDNLRLYFFLYLLKSAASYLFAYKSILISVNQESFYKANITNIVLVLVTILQAGVLYYTSSFITYLVIGIMGTIVTNLWVSLKADQLYPYLKRYKTEVVSEEEKRSIFSFIRATAVDRIAVSVKTATDNVIISSVVNVAVTGIAGNYNMILSTVTTFLGFFYNNVSPAVGNMISTTDKKAQFNTFLDLEYLSFWLYGFLSTGMMCVLTPFVRDLWIRHPEMILPQSTLFWILLNFFLTGTAATPTIYFSATGMIKRMPFINVFTVIINLIASMVLVMNFDVSGVYMGTVASMVLANLPLTIYYTIRYYFEGRFKPFLTLYSYCTFVTILCAVPSIWICNQIIQRGFIGIVLKIIVCTVVYNIVFVFATIKMREFSSIYTLLKNMIGQRWTGAPKSGKSK